MSQRQASGRLQGITTLKELALNGSLTYPERLSAQGLLFAMVCDDAYRDQTFDALAEIALKAPTINERLMAQELLSKVIATDSRQHRDKSSDLRP
jgi:hypothetical protein